MTTFLPHTILQQTLLLSANKTLFWENEKILILSDMHLGKSGHFRKNGIAIPQNIIKEDLVRLATDIQYFKPTQIIIVGDLFHSSYNKEHILFNEWVANYAHIHFMLVLGNHDVLPNNFYTDVALTVHKNVLCIGAFTFTHQIPSLLQNNDTYYFSGHIHPAVIIKGLGKQSLSLPCFHFTEQQAVLPAFGRFTGTYIIKPSATDAVFMLANSNVIKY